MSSDVEMDNATNMVYDPDQDASEKRDLRKNYRGLNKTIEGI